MGKTIRMAVLVIVLSAFAFSATVVSASAKSDVAKAKDFMTAVMYDQAIELLNKRIDEVPSDAEAQYLLGVCYLTTKRYDQASGRLTAAYNFNHDYGKKIGKKYEELGMASFKAGEFHDAAGFLGQAVHFDPNLRERIATLYFNSGKSYLKEKNIIYATMFFNLTVRCMPELKRQVIEFCRATGEQYLDAFQISDANDCFQTILGYAPGMKMDIYNLIMDRADRAADDKCLPLYNFARTYGRPGGARARAAGRRLEAIARQKERANMNDPEIEKFRMVESELTGTPEVKSIALLMKRSQNNYYQKPNQAVKDLTEVIGRCPNLTNAYILRSNAFWNLRRYAESIADTKAVMRIDPNNCWYHFILAYKLVNRHDEVNQDTDEALRQIKAFFDSNCKPSYSAWEVLAQAYADTGDYKQAIDAQTEAIMGVKNLIDKYQDKPGTKKVYTVRLQENERRLACFKAHKTWRTEKKQP